MRICLLRSGSSGNCTFIEHGNTRVLLDAGGFTQAGFLGILAETNAALAHIDAVVVSHLHSDHLNHAALSLFSRNSIPVWVHAENVSVLKSSLQKKSRFPLSVNPFHETPFFIKDIELIPFLVDHDAQKTTSGFKFRGVGTHGSSASYATDLGCFPNALLPHFVNSRVVILEANHDSDLLWNNPLRPYFHKKRVASDFGHLSNAQAAEALVKICGASNTHPESIMLSHLSKDHNSPQRAIEYIGNELKKCGYGGRLLSAYRDRKAEVVEI
jgi:phosphoribosyl 1,2-cyclic phosphodiesterase